MNYKEYLETLIGKKCEFTQTNSSWIIIFNPNAKLNRGIVIKEVHDDFIIIESFDEKVRTIIPLNLLMVQAHLT